MEFFADLESLISSQDATNESAAEFLAEIGSPSVSIAILDHGSITSKCISAIGGDSETLFQPCSISKLINSMATMLLIQAGKLQLDSKIVQLLPDGVTSILETPHTKVLLQQITIRHLMSHTSGINIGHFYGYSKDAPDTETVLSREAPANILQVKVQGLPGYSMSYSGGGMVVLQIILEAFTGKGFPTLVEELTLDPLGMSRSSILCKMGRTMLQRHILRDIFQVMSNGMIYRKRPRQGCGLLRLTF
jgi:CubicO group peptidase (beta-lactamase class C family)